MSSFTFVKSRKHDIRVFTGLRGFAALWVVLLHYTVYLSAGKVLSFGCLSTFLRAGYLGVDVFFVLSGFVLAYQYNEYLAENNPGKMFRYFIRRLARIYPAYLLTLFLVLLLDLTNILTPFAKNFGDFSLKGFFYSLFMLQAWQIREVWAWNIPSWTVSIEWLCYIVFPLLLYLWSYVKKYVVLILIFIVSFMILMTQLHPEMLYYQAMDFGVYRGMAEFSLGMGAYFLSRNFRGGPIYDLLFLLAFSFLIFFIYIKANKGLWVLCSFFLVLFLPFTKDFIQKLFSTKPVIFLGRVSYSLYLLQFSFQAIFNRIYEFLGIKSPFASFAFFLVTITCLIVAASFSYRYIENTVRVKVTGFFPVR